MPGFHLRALSRLWSRAGSRRQQEVIAAPRAHVRQVEALPPPAEDVTTRHFRRLADVVERGRSQMGSIAVNQEAAATRIEAAEHAYYRLRHELADLLNALPAETGAGRPAA